MTASGCATASHVLIGRPHTPLAATEVRVFLEPPSGPSETIAVIDASSRLSLAWTAQAKAETVLRRLKDEAAKLGANAIVLQEITYGAGGTVGAGAGADLGDHGSIGVGLNDPGLLASRSGRAAAIYIEPLPGNP